MRMTYAETLTLDNAATVLRTAGVERLASDLERIADRARQTAIPAALTAPQRAVLDFICAFVDENGYAPNLEEVAEEFGYKSIVTGQEHIGHLVRKGYVVRQHNAVRGLTVIHR